MQNDSVSSAAPAQKRIAVDFDGTLCDEDYPCIGQPKQGAKPMLALLRRFGFEIVIWSCRTSLWDHERYGHDPALPVMERPTVKAMRDWLEENGIEYDQIDDGSRGKPAALAYVDNAGIRFDSNWPEIALFLLSQQIGAKARELPEFEELAAA